MHRFALWTLALAGLPATALADPIGDLRADVTARAQAAGIPPEPLLNKIDEGIAKGVPPARIRPVLTALHTRLVESRAVCAGVADDTLCVLAAADAVAAGAPATALQALIDRHPEALAGPDRARAFVAIAALGARGIPPPAAIEEVAQALTAPDGLDTLVPRATPVSLTPTLPSTGPSTPDGPPAVGRDGTRLGTWCDSADQEHLLREHAAQLGVTAEELAIALDQLALQAELVLHRLRGSPTH